MSIALRGAGVLVGQQPDANGAANGVIPNAANLRQIVFLSHTYVPEFECFLAQLSGLCRSG